MHELSIAESLIEQVLTVARDNQLKRVDEVEIAVGDLRLVIDEVMQTAFRSVIQDTLAQGAQLKILSVKAHAQCLDCLGEFEPEVNNFLCPKCLVANVKILAGNEIILNAVVAYD